MRIIEFHHDPDYPLQSNIDRWIGDHPGWVSRKIPVYQGVDYPDSGQFDLLLLHGGAQHLWDRDSDPWLDEEVEFVRRLIREAKPVIGFCLGSQIIVAALGGKIYPAVAGEIGWYRVRLHPAGREHPVLKGISGDFTSFMWHFDHYELPESLISLGYTALAPHQIVAGRELPVVGFQFHPEYTKENIREYALNCYEDEWAGTENLSPKPDFLADLEQLPETYPLFQGLAENSWEWMQQYRKRP
jgi:GMP synthase (glutamine-hydrolysing)